MGPLDSLAKPPCDGPDWAGPHNAPACAGASSADPDVSPGSTNRVGQRPHQQEPGQLKGQASRLEDGKAIVRREDGITTTEEGDREEAEDRIETPDGRGRPRDLTGPSAPLECGRGEKTRNSAVPIGYKGSWLRGAERYFPPRFRRSVAESGTWTLPGQG
ncbi:hypothetical protein NDU88_011205 [Pleurodeles waltl]|uniref:Uncharacterized protein n=1 Tax=Pleurodeles waltl TaxID=8319 RepID=A0AAV7R0R4_PLEWA|nr:hypothetical protein NDU88_011205 [Pleurodeles waltl]